MTQASYQELCQLNQSIKDKIEAERSEAVKLFKKIIQKFDSDYGTKKALKILDSNRSMGRNISNEVYMENRIQPWNLNLCLNLTETTHIDFVAIKVMASKNHETWKFKVDGQDLTVNFDNSEETTEDCYSEASKLVYDSFLQEIELGHNLYSLN